MCKNEFLNSPFWQQPEPDYSGVTAGCPEPKFFPNKDIPMTLASRRPPGPDRSAAR
jgi:hypothetical protein